MSIFGGLGKVETLEVQMEEVLKRLEKVEKALKLAKKPAAKKPAAKKTTKSKTKK